MSIHYTKSTLGWDSNTEQGAISTVEMRTEEIPLDIMFVLYLRNPFQKLPSHLPQSNMHVCTHTHPPSHTKALLSALSETPDPSKLHAGAQAMQQIHPQPQPMCWLAAGASHSNGLSHLRGRQAHGLTLCVPLARLRASQDSRRSGGRNAKTPTREPHGERLGLHRTAPSILSALGIGRHHNNQKHSVSGSREALKRLLFAFFYFLPGKQHNRKTRGKGRNLWFIQQRVQFNAGTTAQCSSCAKHLCASGNQGHASSCPRLIRCFYKLPTVTEELRYFLVTQDRSLWKIQMPLHLQIHYNLFRIWTRP